VLIGDAGHPAPGLKNQPSVASLVWSYDRFAARYEATMLIQHPSIIDTAVVATCLRVPLFPLFLL
ncbi:hypothetical protein M405DRAFT_806508, partial [Rhizopogon salebrosus TDB-379]